MAEVTVDAISDITDPDLIRVVLFINNRFIHAPLPALVQHLLTDIETLQTQVADLEARVTALENP